MTTLASIVGRGVVGSRPAAGTAGQLYFATDVTGGVWQRDNGSTWDTDVSAGKLQLAYTVPTGTDLINGTSVTTTTWTDLLANQSFTVDQATSLLIFEASFSVTYANSNAAAGNIATRLVVDSAGTPQNLNLGGMQFAASGYANPFNGAGTRRIPSLAAGSHTVKIQYYVTQAGNLYLRSNTQPNIEFGALTVTEQA